MLSKMSKMSKLSKYFFIYTPARARTCIYKIKLLNLLYLLAMARVQKHVH